MGDVRNTDTGSSLWSDLLSAIFVFLKDTI